MTLLGGAAAWPLAVGAQHQTALPVAGFVNARTADASLRLTDAFRRGLIETGYVDGRNVTVEYHWLEGKYDHLPSLMADFVRRRVAVIATPGSNPAALAAKAATTTIPIVFGVGEDPVKLGLVASLAQPGGNATGINFFLSEVLAKRLGLLHELVPKAVRIAVLVNPANASTAEATLREIPEAARAIGLQIQVLKASTSREIEEAFATLVRDRADALFIAPDGFFGSRRVQFATLAARHVLPTAHTVREPLMRSPRRMPIGNQRDAIAKTCRSKRAYSFLICTRTLSNSALAARAARSASRAAPSAKMHCQATSGSLPSPPGCLTNISPAGSPIERRTAEALRRTSRTSAAKLGLA
jgi:putative ABC transport system substrate-binding protein